MPQGYLFFAPAFPPGAPGLACLRAGLARSVVPQEDWQNLEQPQVLPRPREGQEGFKTEQKKSGTVTV